MERVINCECGERVYGSTDDELIANAERHIAERHPELVGRMSREDLLMRAQST
jgi:hypothetical protein